MNASALPMNGALAGGGVEAAGCAGGGGGGVGGGGGAGGGGGGAGSGAVLSETEAPLDIQKDHEPSPLEISGSACATSADTPRITAHRAIDFTTDMANLLFVGPGHAVMASSTPRPSSGPPADRVSLVFGPCRS